jgi:hypothetical protein
MMSACQQLRNGFGTLEILKFIITSSSALAGKNESISGRPSGGWMIAITM